MFAFALLFCCKMWSFSIFSPVPSVLFQCVLFCPILSHPILWSVLFFFFCPLSLRKLWWTFFKMNLENNLQMKQQKKWSLEACLFAWLRPFCLSSNDSLSFVQYCPPPMYPLSFCPLLSCSLLFVLIFLLVSSVLSPCSCHSPVSFPPVPSSSDMSPSCLFLLHLFLSCPRLFSAAPLCSLTAQRRHQSSRTLPLSTCTLFTSPKRQTAPLEPPVSEEGSGGNTILWWQPTRAHPRWAYYMRVQQSTQVQVKTEALSIWPHGCITTE